MQLKQEIMYINKNFHILFNIILRYFIFEMLKNWVDNDKET